MLLLNLHVTFALVSWMNKCKNIKKQEALCEETESRHYKRQLDLLDDENLDHRQTLRVLLTIYLLLHHVLNLAEIFTEKNLYWSGPLEGHIRNFHFRGVGGPLASPHGVNVKYITILPD